MERYKEQYYIERFRHWLRDYNRELPLFLDGYDDEIEDMVLQRVERCITALESAGVTLEGIENAITRRDMTSFVAEMSLYYDTLYSQEPMSTQLQGAMPAFNCFMTFMMKLCDPAVVNCHGLTRCKVVSAKEYASGRSFTSLLGKRDRNKLAVPVSKMLEIVRRHNVQLRNEYYSLLHDFTDNIIILTNDGCVRLMNVVWIVFTPGDAVLVLLKNNPTFFTVYTFNDAKGKSTGVAIEEMKVTFNYGSKSTTKEFEQLSLDHCPELSEMLSKAVIFGAIPAIATAVALERKYGQLSVDDLRHNGVVPEHLLAELRLLYQSMSLTLMYKNTNSASQHSNHGLTQQASDTINKMNII